MGNTWVVNASPLILLGKIGQLDLLPRLCAERIIPAGVAQELARGPAGDPARAWVERQGRSLVRPVHAVDLVVAAWDLGLGESHVLQLCYGHPEREAILDDRAARRCALALRVPARGTLAVAVLAKRAGLVPAAGPLLHELVAKGAHVEARLIEHALWLAGEA